MPEASIHVSIEGLSGALSGVTALLGAPGGDAPGTGLAGGAAEVSVTPAARMDGFGVDLTARLSGTLTFDAGGITGAGEMFATLRGAATTPPTDALAGFGAQITAAGTAFDTGFIGRLTEAAEAVRGLVEGIPQNPTAVVSALLDQILAVLGTLNGPEAEAIRAWIQSLQEQHAQLMPLIEEAMEAEDPAALVLDVFRRALEGTLEVFGYGEVRRFVADLDRLSAGLVPAPALQALGTAGAGLEGAYATLVGLVGADIVEYRQAVVDAAAALNQVNDAFRAVAGVLNRVATTPMLQPGALEAWLRARMDEALGVRVHEVQRIDD
ncbi:MAG TPA: hypothetical protein VFR37_09865, partial [Longimicrobium sp.]|nr:hypothetical protein [Longimicrobium sp.]